MLLRKNLILFQLVITTEFFKVYLKKWNVMTSDVIRDITDVLTLFILYINRHIFTLVNYLRYGCKLIIAQKIKKAKEMSKSIKKRSRFCHACRAT